MSFMKKLGDALNKAGEKAGEFADYASDKANVVATQTKYKMEQQKLKGKIPTLYKELGEKIYLAMKDDLGHDVLTETVNDYTNQLDAVNAEILELDKKIEEVAQSVEDDVAEVQENVEQQVEAVQENVEQQVEAVQENVEQKVDEVQENAEQFKADAQQNVEDLTQSAQEGVEEVKENFENKF